MGDVPAGSGLQGEAAGKRRESALGVPLSRRRSRLETRTAWRLQIGTGRDRSARRALERLRRERGLVEAPPLRELVEIYLAQHDGEPETVAKLRWLLAKAVGSFGHRRISHLRRPKSQRGE
jgi:hypothetical protein